MDNGNANTCHNCKYESYTLIVEKLLTLVEISQIVTTFFAITCN